MSNFARYIEINCDEPTIEAAGSNRSRADLALDQADKIGDVQSSIVTRLVAQQHDVTPQELFHHSRSRAPIATTRQIAMYLTHVLLGRSLTDVGLFFGRDRTTVAHACARIEDMRDDPEFEREITELEDKIWKTLSGLSFAAVPDNTQASANDE